MKEKEKQILYSLFRDLEDVYAPSYTSIVALQSFIDSLKSISLPKVNLKKQILDLSHVVKDTEPRIFPLNHILNLFEKKLENKKDIDKLSREELKEFAVNVLSDECDHLMENINKLVEIGVDNINDGDFILIYSVSMPVMNIIIEAHNQNKVFDVLVVEQDFKKSREIIRKLKEIGVKLHVVPVYNLSHYIEKVTKSFIGANTVTKDNKMITSTGTSNVISLSNVYDVPVYLFVNSMKFSHRDSTEQKIHHKMNKKQLSNVEYDLNTHSHDAIKIELVDKIFIEEGEITKDDIASYRMKH